MNLPPDRQGHIEDLIKYTLPQLRELLERQEKILTKKKFLASLPDKGEKSRAFAGKIQAVISEREGRFEKTSNDFHQIHVNTFSADGNDGQSVVATLVSRNENDVTFKSEESKGSGNPTQELLKQMQELSVGNKADEVTKAPANSYEKVIKKAELEHSTTVKRFTPNRTKTDMDPNSCPVKKPATSKIHDESAVYPPQYKCDTTKLISIEESIHLLQEQRHKTEQLVAERAAQRLANHFASEMETYQPLTTDMRYRQSNDNEDSDDVASEGDDSS